MPDKAPDDEVVMSLVELALARPEAERTAYLTSACAGDAALFEQVWHYVEWEGRMQGFLLDPFYSLDGLEHPFEPGELLLERFRIVREVAQGGMGVVYEAIDEKLDRRIALKCPKAGFRKRLPPEVRNATEISHSNVCKTFEIHTASTRVGEFDFLTMEFLEGETLAERLAHGPLTRPESLTVARQLCAGLAEAHRNKVIHGDLKSNNVILATGADGGIRAVITDFGLARGPEGTVGPSAPPEMGGTPDYMAPELWRGEALSVGSDIYALGVILFELACGRKPFPSGSAGTTVSDQERSTRKPPPAQQKWDRILARCLEGEPQRRFQSVDEIAKALAPPRSRRSMIALAAIAVIAVGSAIVTNQRVTTPTQVVRLAMLPFRVDGGAGDPVRGIFQEAAKQLERLKGGAQTKLTVIPLTQVERGHLDTPEQARDRLGATHVLHGSLEKKNDQLLLHAYVTDTHSMVNVKEWSAAYAPGETRYIPAALGGMVTDSLRLPPLASAATVNAAAQQDYLKGSSYVRRDSGVDVALGFLERAVAEDPDSPLTHAGLAEAAWFKYYLSRNKMWLDRATESLRQAELRNPDLAPVHRIAGVLTANSGRYEQASAEYRRAIELEPRNGDAYRRLGQVYERNNQPDEAIAQYRRALEVDPGDYRTYQAIGNFFYTRDNYDEALKFFAKTVELAPDESVAHFALGSVFTETGDFLKAESEFRFAIRLKETATALHALGRSLRYQSKDGEAISYFLAALKLNERYISWMELGNCYRRLGQASAAVRAYGRALELAEAEMALNPRDSHVRAFVAYLCARLGDRRRSESEIAQALQLSAGAPETREMAAVTYEVLGLRDSTLGILTGAPAEMLADLSRWPDLADLQKDSGFHQLLTSRQIK